MVLERDVIGRRLLRPRERRAAKGERGGARKDRRLGQFREYLIPLFPSRPARPSPVIYSSRLMATELSSDSATNGPGGAAARGPDFGRIFERA